MAEDPIAYRFKPANEGDFVYGIPARDLTESEAAELREREPAAFANATTPHPTTGKALYQPVAQAKRAKADADADKEA
jgi:hypothetical protein